MRPGVFGSAILAGVFAVATLAAVAPTRQAAVIKFITPTLVAGTALLGPVVFEHDDGKMARGEPCTTVYQYDAKTNSRGRVITAFMCVPRDRPQATKFEATISRVGVTGPNRLTEYQFAGDHEGHGVPYAK